MKYKDSLSRGYVNGYAVGTRIGTPLGDAANPDANPDSYDHIRSIEHFGGVLRDGADEKDNPYNPEPLDE